jgi:hypothetical protein
MHYVLLATHSPELCPLGNSKTKQLLLESASDIPNLAQKGGVTFVAGPFVNREHTIVAVVDADSAESVDQFLVDSRLAHWNTVRILPSLAMEEGLEQIRQQEAIF